ncbi:MULTISPECIES: immunity 52 family protein [Achromobacter]|uniref:Immunity 52 family protein n=1 Tax=Achromobacter denitrificans TaxID=32002 RepID=A0A6N0JG97_ACHDE|nr:MULTISPECIES: immunity 52 family protein [Achromobacter]QKQ46151.1 immunity 52 family protein [Achromobacter denitrificans]
MIITCKFRDPTLASEDFLEMLRRMHSITVLLAEKSEGLENWFAQGDSIEEAYLYPAFEDGEPSTALLAVLNHKYRNDKSFTLISIWNGASEQRDGVSLALHANDRSQPCTLTVSNHKQRDDRFGGADSVKDIVVSLVKQFHPLYVSVSPRHYAQKQVFDDKPGVGWMLYLPKVITAQQVPEAQALIPVPAAGKKQTGTIIVSVADEVFSLDNPNHVELANHIEMRLVDQDLLPRYADL